MQNFKISNILFSILFSATLSVSAVDRKPWTFFVYMAADNSLDEFSDINIKQIQEGVNDNVNALVCVSTKRQGNKVTKRLVITKDKITEISSTQNVDSGDYKILLDEIEWALTYPSDHLLIDLWNHGSGWKGAENFHRPWLISGGQERGICYDDTTNNYIKDADLKNVLEVIKKIQDWQQN